MLNIEIAIEAAQKVNRDAWLKNAESKLSNQILSAANVGKRDLVVDINDLVVGAEDLCEAGEMLIFICKALDEGGYKHVIEPDGTFIVSW